jgi:hypothetical protein
MCVCGPSVSHSMGRCAPPFNTTMRTHETVHAQANTHAPVLTSSTAAKVAFLASSMRSFLSSNSASVAAPT